jgi:hypothetical protein
MDPVQQPREQAPAEVPAADRFVDDLLPEELDWRRMVRSYPLPVLAAAAVGGFLLGRRHGDEIVAALRAFVDREVSKNVQSLLGEADS